MADLYPAISPHTYVANNPIILVDPDGRFIETAWDVSNVVMGVASFVSNVKSGNVLGAVVDAVGVVVDAAATVTPIVPGGVGTAIKAARGLDKAVDVVQGVDKAGDSNKVYRALSEADTKNLAEGKDLVARSPDADNTPISHVANKKESQWISTTKDKNIAKEKYDSGNGVVEIDLNKVDSESVDLSGGIPNGGRFSNYAKKDQEVLIKNTIPNSAVQMLQ